MEDPFLKAFTEALRCADRDTCAWYVEWADARYVVRPDQAPLDNAVQVLPGDTIETARARYLGPSVLGGVAHHYVRLG